MPDSSLIVFPGHGFDPSDPRHMEAWLGSVPPAATVNRRDIAGFVIRCGSRPVSFRVTRAALEAIAGTGEGSTAMLAQRHFDAIEHHCAALFERSATPIKGWVLDVADLITP